MILYNTLAPSWTKDGQSVTLKGGQHPSSERPSDSDIRHALRKAKKKVDADLK